jgi:malonyl-CoA decarboxylase
LIKQVVEELRAEMPSLKSFATLSPIPTFRKWLDAQFSAEAETVLLPEERAAIGNSPAIFQESDGVKLEQMDAAGKAILQRLLAAYLTARNDGKGPDDPVARFHLRNGARLERVNWSANLSHRGISESLGMMVNYVYELELIESNHERFIAEGCVAHSAEVGELLKRKSRIGHAKPVRREAPEASQWSVPSESGKI